MVSCTNFCHLYLGLEQCLPNSQGVFWYRYLCKIHRITCNILFINWSGFLDIKRTSHWLLEKNYVLCMNTFIVLQIWWHVSSPHYWEHTWGEGPQGENGQGNEWIPRLLRRARQTARCLRLGRDVGEGQNHVSVNQRPSRISHHILNVRGIEIGFSYLKWSMIFAWVCRWSKWFTFK